VKRLILLTAPVVLVPILAKLPRPVVSDANTSLADTNIRDNGITISQTEVSNLSASATTTITMGAMGVEQNQNKLRRRCV
jgi:hypothetical protein